MAATHSIYREDAGEALADGSFDSFLTESARAMLASVEAYLARHADEDEVPGPESHAEDSGPRRESSRLGGL